MIKVKCRCVMLKKKNSSFVFSWIQIQKSLEGCTKKKLVIKNGCLYKKFGDVGKGLPLYDCLCLLSLTPFLSFPIEKIKAYLKNRGGDIFNSSSQLLVYKSVNGHGEQLIHHEISKITIMCALSIMLNLI